MGGSCSSVRTVDVGNNSYAIGSGAGVVLVLTQSGFMSNVVFVSAEALEVVGRQATSINFAQMMAFDPSDHLNMYGIFETKPADGVITQQELVNNPLFQSLLAPDIQLRGNVALSLGFGHVESGPLVRSSYHAHEQADALAAARG